MKSLKTVFKKKFKSNPNTSQASSVKSSDNPKTLPQPFIADVSTETASSQNIETVEKELEQDAALQQRLKTDMSTSETTNSARNEFNTVDEEGQVTPDCDPSKEGEESTFVPLSSTWNLTQLQPTATGVLDEQENLWNEAYDSLTLEAPKLVEEGEEILLSVSGAHTPIGQNDAISDADATTRRQQMSRLLSTWLQNRNGDGTGRLQNLLRDHVEESTGTSPASALAWTPLCYASSVLSAPQPETQSICLEFIRVICKMNWYASLSKLSSAQGDGRDEEASLRKGIIDLYTAILSYGMNALVLSLDFSHDSQITIWEDISARLRAAEENLSLFSGSVLKQHLDDAVVFDGKEGKRRDVTVEKYAQVTNRILKQLKYLGYVDPRMGLQEPRVERRFSAGELFQGICSMNEYNSVVDWDGGMSTVLFISGPPGVGKTTLMEAIVRHLLDEAKSNATKPRQTEPDQDQNRSGHEVDVLSDADSTDKDSDISNSDSSNSDSSSSISTDLEREISTLSKDMPWALAYYFCGRTGHGLDNSARVLRSLIYSLLRQQPRMICHLKEMKRATGRDRLDNSNDFIALSGILFQMLKDDQFIRTYFVLDGIDEHSFHDDENGLNDLLHLIRTAVRLQPKARWLISADTNVRVEWVLGKVEGFKHLLHKDITRKAPAGTFDGSVRNIISDLFKQRNYDASSRDRIEQLVREKSKGNTIWSVVACATLRKEDNWYAIEVLQEMPPRLEDLYDYARACIQKLPRRDPEFCHTVLSTMAIAFRPLSVQELTRLADLPPSVDTVTIVEKCGSFLEIREGIVEFVNPSARHNLRKHLSGPSTPELSQAHSRITRKALVSLTAYFKQGQTSPEDLTNKYETLHWLMHLLNVDDIANDIDTADSVTRFFEDYFLCWLDAMIQDGLHIDAGTLMRRLEVLLSDQSKSQEDKSPLLLRIVQDAGRIIGSHATENSVFHPNPRSVIFYPEDSALKQRWLAKHKAWLITAPTTAKSWGDNLPIMTGHSDWIRDIAFSSDGRLLASGSDDTTVRIWDVETGAAQLTLQDHYDYVRTVAFSVSGQLATGSDDLAIHIWDPITGNLLQTLPEQDSSVMAIRFSPDGGRLAVATLQTLSLWDISDLSEPVKTELEQFEDGCVVLTIEYSQTGLWIASPGQNNTIQIWGATDNKLHTTLPGHDLMINTVAFSPDERYVASGSDDCKIKICDIESGTVFHTFDCEACVLSVAFSPNPQKLSLAAGSENRTVQVWDLTTKELTSVLKGHQRYVRTIAFLRDDFIASGSDDMTIRFWRPDRHTANPENCEEDSIERGSVNLIAISPDGLYLASASDSSVYLWDGITGLPTEHHILSGHDSSIKSIVFSPDGKRLVSTSSDASAIVWDVASGTVLRTFRDHTDWVRYAAFSIDGRYIASASDDRTVRIWETEKKEEDDEPRLLEEHGDWVRAVAFSPDGKLLASGGDDHTVRVWDFASLKLLCELKSNADVIAIVFSRDSSRVIARSRDADVRIWDVSTGELIGDPIRTKGVRRYALFDPRIPEYLLTEFGADSPGPESSSFLGERSAHDSLYGISALGDSITRNGREVIPIPERYEPTASWVQGHTVAFGTESGEVLLFRFSTAEEPI